MAKAKSYKPFNNPSINAGVKIEYCDAGFSHDTH